MKRLWNANFLVISLCFFLFLPGFTTYFHQDDFIHFSYSQTFQQVIQAFNIFQRGEFPFYRPIPTQTYFYLGKLLFGYNPFGYHMINYIIFSVNIILAYRLVKLIAKTEKIAFLSVLFYGANSTHVAPLFSPAYVHELFYVLFGLLTVVNFFHWIINRKISNYVASLVCFILALMSKETAVVLPGILVLLYLYRIRKNILHRLITAILPFTIILIIYLLAHFFYYGIASGPSYKIILGKPTLNILFWYFIWALSTPNILIDFAGPGIKINQIFFQVAQINGLIYILFFPALIILGCILLISLIFSSIKSNKFEQIRLIMLGILWFVIGLIPLIIFPLHKLATEQAFSLTGLSLALGVVVYRGFLEGKIKKLFSILFLVIYLAIVINSVFLATRTHWIVRSARQAENVIGYFQKNYNNLSDNAIIYFKNGKVKIPEWGSSRQIYLALGEGRGLKLILNRPNLQLFFEDVNPLSAFPDKNTKAIEVDSSVFLGY